MKHLTRILAAVAVGIILPTGAFSQDVGRVQPQLTAPARDDVSNSTTNAVVLVGGGCSGTLIASNIVITAGHCLPPGVEGGESGIWSDSRAVWRPLPARTTVSFGNARRAPVHTAVATHYSLGGFDDIALIRLTNPVLASVAQPTRILTELPNSGSPSQWLREQTYQFSGWGGGHPIRRTSAASFAEYPFTSFGTVQPNMKRMTGAGGTTLEGGDSGSPTLLLAPVGRSGLGTERFVSGVAQGVEASGGRFVTPFGRGGRDSQGNAKPHLARWIDSALYEAVYGNAAMIPLYSWWHAGRQDNNATTDRRWASYPRGLIFDPRNGGEHILNQRQQDGYSQFRFEGMAFNPRRPQPPGTVPLFSWWHPGRQDNMATTDPRWSMNPAEVQWNASDGRGSEEHIRNGRVQDGYRLYRLEGYIYDPRRPQPPGTVPLFSWWHPGRQDNMATTDPRWSTDPTRLRWRGEHIEGGPQRGGYTLYRLEGYVPIATNAIR